MRRLIITLTAALTAVFIAGARQYNVIPSHWKWLDDNTAAFSFDGSYTDSTAFAIAIPSFVRKDVPASAAALQVSKAPVKDAVNATYSPDSSKIAFTRENDLYVYDLSSGDETRLTFDGGSDIFNGYAAWVYYEEILGRASRYKAFWWSPDSRKIGFYRFDNRGVPSFPIYSASGQDGRLGWTAYPKAGEPNPEVRIGMVDITDGRTVWADFEQKQDQYFGIPFWGADSRHFYIAREPRVQNTIDLYAVSAKDGSKHRIYHEQYPTWVNWMDDILFGEKGLYMVRAFETGWEQIYFLSYDGKRLKRLSNGPNWRTKLVRIDEKKGNVFFTSQRDSDVRTTLYRLSRDGEITALTDTSLSVASVSFSPDGQHFIASLSNSRTPTQIWICETSAAARAWKVADLKGDDFDSAGMALPQLVYIPAEDGQMMPALVTWPKDFNPDSKYPVHMEVYGGPNTAYVRDSWRTVSQWWSDHGIIHLVADSRAAGHTGRAGTDLVHRDLVSVPVRDFVTWAGWLQGQPYVIPDKIGVEGFSFGGTMTAMLVMTRPGYFHYGIAGGGVYDWALYDSHYTERYMDTPANNPEGYKAARVLEYVDCYPVGTDPDGSVMLKLTHGTGDDNVHFQNTLQLIDALQRHGKQFELMIYPDGMHGYRGSQAAHDTAADRIFWQKYLLQ